MKKLRTFLEQEGFFIIKEELDKIVWKKGRIVVFSSKYTMEIFRQPFREETLKSSGDFEFKSINQIRKFIKELT